MSKTPHYDVFVTEKSENTDPGVDEPKAFWTKIGAAWKHGDGKGINIVLKALPLDGNLILREYKPKEA